MPKSGGPAVDHRATTELPRVRSPLSAGIPTCRPSRHCDEWVASLFRPSEVKTAGKAMANHPKMSMLENWATNW